MISAWYKPFHEPSRDQIEPKPDESLRALDLHDLKALKAFWWGEVKSGEVSESIAGWRGRPITKDRDLAVGKLARLNAEIARREHEGEI